MKWTLAILLSFTFIKVWADEELNRSNKTRNIGGEQSTKITMVAKIKNGPIPQHIMNLIRNNEPLPTTYTEALGDKTPFLITDNVKTTTTRLEIPLSTKFMDDDWYKTTLKKFLDTNKISITKSDMLESPDDSSPSYERVVAKLQAGIQLRNNLITMFGKILQNNAITLPPQHHPALSLIFHLLRLRRISVIGMLENLDSIREKDAFETYFFIFSELWKTVPKFALSSVTLWLESLQDHNLISSYLLSKFPSNEDLTSNIFKNSSLAEPLLFPKSTVLTAKENHKEMVGKTIAIIFSALGEKHLLFNPELFNLLILYLPLNQIAVDDNGLTKLPSATQDEDKIFFQSLKGIQGTLFKAPIVEIFKTVLNRILKYPNFDGRSKYNELLATLEPPSEEYIFNSL